MNIKREWNFIVGATHNRKPYDKNYLPREILLILEVLLSKIEVEKTYSRILFLKQIYFKTKYFYLTPQKNSNYASNQK